MRVVGSAILIAICCGSTSGYLHHNSGCTTADGLSFSRRNVLRNVGAAFVGASSMIVANGGALAVDACRANARNCIRTRWVPPTGLSKSEIVQDLRDALSSYPQEGQSGVDCNGWSVASDDLDGNSLARVEYRSCIGPAAISMNLGRPFVDDLKLEMGEDGTVQVRSSSRIGSSDFGVNKKRVNYLAVALRSKGWDAPKVTYGIASYDAIF